MPVGLSAGVGVGVGEGIKIGVGVSVGMGVGVTVVFTVLVHDIPDTRNPASTVTITRPIIKSFFILYSPYFKVLSG